MKAPIYLSVVATDIGRQIVVNLYGTAECDCHGSRTWKKRITAGSAVDARDYWAWCQDALEVAYAATGPCGAEVLDGWELKDMEGCHSES